MGMPFIGMARYGWHHQLFHQKREKGQANYKPLVSLAGNVTVWGYQRSCR